MIEFGTMYVEGFASIKEETFSWNKPGLNIIQAPNGHGKTTFINALVWCLYGKTLSGSAEKWPHLRDSSYQGVFVKQTLFVNDIPIVIKRYKGYSKFKNALILEIDGPEEEKGDKAEIQDKINNLLGYSYDLFKNSIIFGQKLKRIISETGPNKKKVFDDAFEIGYLPKAKKIAEEKLKEFKEEERKAELIHVKIIGELNSKQAEIDAQQNLIDNFEQQKKEELKAAKIKVREKRETHAELLKTYNDGDERLRELNHELEIWEKDMVSDKEYLKMEKKLTKLEGELDRAKEDKDIITLDIEITKKAVDNISPVCNQCLKPFTEKEKKQEKNRLLLKSENYQSFLKQNKETIGNIEGQINELNGEISSALKLKKEYDTTSKMISALEEQKEKIDRSEEELQSLIDNKVKIRNKTLVNNLEKLNVELRDLEIDEKAKAKAWKKVKRDSSAYEWVIKDPLSNSGIKAFVFNLMLDDINERLAFYSKYIGFQVAFFMDMKSANKNLETYVFIGDNPVPYGDLSGGQQQSVDIASAFAIHDIVSDSKSCSLLVMDEVFESLDKDNIEIMTEVIQDKAQEKCLYLVTHRSEFNPTNSNIINIDYANGITSLG